jgi:hypothetical protein
MTIDTRMYPLEVVYSAVNTLDEGIDVSLDPVSETAVTVSLSWSRSNGSGDDAEMRRSLNRALIAARVAGHAFHRTQSIRSFLAQTAFSITSQNQQTIEEFTAGLLHEREQEHAGAATPGQPERPMVEPDEEETRTGNQWQVDEESGDVVVWVDTNKHVLPEVLWAAYEMGNTCPCSVTNLNGNQVSVVMEPAGETPEQLVANLERWLAKASEHLQ